MITLDFETRSAAELQDVGTWNYSIDPSTIALCAAWAYDVEGDDTELWHPAFPAIDLPERGTKALVELHQRIRDGEEIEAHNAFFERCIWENVMRRLFGWPEVRPSQWRCTAARAASYNLPRKLEKACLALNLRHKKDMEGSRDMLKLSKPRRPTKGDPYSAWVYDRALFDRCFAYCRRDVLAERELGRSLRPLPPEELRAWQVDQNINMRGVHCDAELARKSIEVAKIATERANATIEAETGGAVRTTKQVAAITDWLGKQNVVLADLTADTVEAALRDPAITGAPRIVLEARRAASKSSASKFEAMLARMDPRDHRIRDMLRYHGAGTGRWAGQGVQPHNFPRGDLKVLLGVSTEEELKAWKKRVGDAAEHLCRDVLAMSHDELAMLYNDPMTLLANTVRSTLTAGPGRVLYAADYSAIEACGTFWVADDQDALQIMRDQFAGNGPGIYREMAAEIFKIPAAPIGKDSMERQVGKAAILGLGYQMGSDKFQSQQADAGVNLDDEFCQKVVDAYRAKFWKVVKFWAATGDAAKLAVLRGDGAEPIIVGKTQWAIRGRFLHCKLPSGRLLSYYRPRIEMRKKRRSLKYGGGEFVAETITFMGVDQKTKAWVRQDTYGGKLTENIVQALSRDLLRDAMVRLENELEAGREPYETVMTVHDEVVAEADEGRGDLRHFEELISRTEPWAAGMPVQAEGWRGRRYKK